MGGGTTKVGDPSGRDETRQLLTDQQINSNSAGIREIFGRGEERPLRKMVGRHISIGGPLFRQVGAGRSSWAAFYDPGSPFQVVVSVQAVPSGLDVDPLSLF